MFGNRSVVQEQSLRDRPRAGQFASRLASPMSFNCWGLGICGQDWPGWPGISRSDPVAGVDTWKHHQRTGGVCGSVTYLVLA
jgi:hypothetical protein